MLENFLNNQLVLVITSVAYFVMISLMLTQIGKLCEGLLLKWTNISRKNCHHLGGVGFLVLGVPYGLLIIYSTKGDPHNLFLRLAGSIGMFLLAYMLRRIFVKEGFRLKDKVSD